MVKYIARRKKLIKMNPKNFFTEYSRTGIAKCRQCRKILAKDGLRIASVVKAPRHAYFEKHWYHVDCMFSDLFTSAPNNPDEISNFETLRYEDQIYLLDKMGMKVNETSDQETLIKEQSIEYWNFVEKLRLEKKKFLKSFLIANGYSGTLRGVSEHYHKVAEFLTFGATWKCSKCYFGNMIHIDSYWQCRFWVTDHLRCMTTVSMPKRRVCVIPDSFKNGLLKNYVQKEPKDWIMRSGSNNILNEPLGCDENENIEPQTKKQKVICKNLSIDDATTNKFKVNFKTTHIYKTNENVSYSCNLYKGDQQLGYNCFYQLKIRAEDVGDKFWVTYEYGAIGTERGNQVEHSFSKIENAIKKFNKIYADKTGNVFESKGPRRKNIGKYVHLDIDYQQYKAERKLEKYLQHTKLDEHIKHLLENIFSVKMMEQTMMEFEIDRNLLPLGLMSSETITIAIEILKNIFKLLDVGTKPSNLIFIDLTNKFNEKIPPVIGDAISPIINNLTILEQKCELVQHLLSIQIAYKLCNSGQNPFDKNYRSLRTEIKTLKSEDLEFKTIYDYAFGTFDNSLTGFEIEIENIFKLAKQREAENFKNHSNNMLLFHGSRMSSFASILENGLLINPFGLYYNGSVFGQGIYFTDNLTRAIEFSKKPKEVKRGLILVSQVALGEVHETAEALGVDFNGKSLPLGKQSVKAMGKFSSDETQTLPDGCIIPKGRVKGNLNSANLALFNEFVIFDTSQCKMRYLIEIKFT